MTNAMYLQAFIALLNLAFFAGGAWFLIRQSRKDLNGIGRKVGQIAVESDHRFTVLAVVLLTMCEDEERDRIADKILSAVRRENR